MIFVVSDNPNNLFSEKEEVAVRLEKELSVCGKTIKLFSRIQPKAVKPLTEVTPVVDESKRMGWF